MPIRAMRRGSWIAALLLAATWLPLPGFADELKPFAASYSITYRGLTAGEAELRLEELTDGRWSYRSQTSPRGFLGRLFQPAELSMSQRSVFRFQYDRLIPESFTADDGSSNDSKDQDLTFDRAAGRVHGIAERKPVDLPLQPGLLDELSVHIALMHALTAGRIPESFLMLDGDRVKEYLYTPEGQEQVQTDVGEYDTVVFRSSRPGSRKGTWFWCAPELGYLPVKIETRDGQKVLLAMRLQKIER